MRTKILFAAVTLAVFIGGAMIRAHVRPGSQTDPSQAYATQGPVPTYATPQPAEARSHAETRNYAEPAPSAQAMAPTQAVAPPPEPAFQPQPVLRHRSLRRQALIVGGSAAAGTAIGAVAGGGKGAAVGAVSGGVAGLVYDLLTKNR